MGWTTKLFMVDSILYMSISFRFIYSPRKIPGKRLTNLFVYHVPACLVLHTLRAIFAIYRKHSSSTRWLAHFWKRRTNQWLKANIIHACTYAKPVQPTSQPLCLPVKPTTKKPSSLEVSPRKYVLGVYDITSIWFSKYEIFIMPAQTSVRRRIVIPYCILNSSGFGF